MMFGNLKSSLAVIGHGAKFFVKRKAPEILVYGGVGLMLVGTGLAIKASTSFRYLDIICDHNESMENIERAKVKAEGQTKIDEDTGEEVEVYSVADQKHDRFLTKRTAAWELTKLYAPSATVLATGTACVLAGFGIIKKRHAALTVAYTVLDKCFKDYRGRVRSELGDAKDIHFLYGTEEVERTETIVDEEGHKKKVTITDQVLNGQTVSGYARVYSKATSRYWTEDGNWNTAFIKSKLMFLNDRLRIYGYVMLNDAYDELGLEKTTAGSIVGWTRDRGDGFVSFGPWSGYDHGWVNGRPEEMLLDFNVDGPVNELIDVINAEKK